MDLSKIRNAINSDIQLEVSSDYKVLTLKEHDTSAKLKALKISGLDNETVAFELDSKKISQVCLAFNKSAKYINKASDAIIITSKDNKLYCVICELKSDCPKRIDFTNQMKASKLFLSYLKENLNCFYDYEMDTRNIINILFTTKRIHKQTLRKRDAQVKTFNNTTYFEESCNRGHSNISTVHIKKYLTSI